MHGPAEPHQAPGEQVDNTRWVVGAIIAIAVLAAVLTFIGWQANKGEDATIAPGLAGAGATPTPTPGPEVPGMGAEAPDSAVDSAVDPAADPAATPPAVVEVPPAEAPPPAETPPAEQPPAEQPPAEAPPAEQPPAGQPATEEGVTDPDAPTMGSGVGGTQGHSEPGTPEELAGQSDPGDPGETG